MLELALNLWSKAIIGIAGVLAFFRRTYTDNLGADYTFTRATTALVKDHLGIYHEAKANEARFQGARRVENLLEYTTTDVQSDAMTNVSHSANVSITENAGTIEIPGLGEQSYSRAVGSGSDTQVAWNIPASEIGDLSGRVFAFVVWVWGDAGSGYAVRIIAQDPGNVEIHNNFNGQEVTSTPKQFVVFADFGDVSSQQNLQARIDGPEPGTGFTFNYACGMVAETTHQADPFQPPEYVSVGVGTGPELYQTWYDYETGWQELGSFPPTITELGENNFEISFQGGQANARFGSANNGNSNILPPFNVTFQARWVSGATTGYVADVCDVPGSVTTLSLDAEWQDVSISAFSDSFPERAFLDITNPSAGVIEVRNISVKLCDPGKVGVDGVQYFPYENGNSVADGLGEGLLSGDNSTFDSGVGDWDPVSEADVTHNTSVESLRATRNATTTIFGCTLPNAAPEVGYVSRSRVRVRRSFADANSGLMFRAGSTGATNINAYVPNDGEWYWIDITGTFDSVRHLFFYQLNTGADVVGDWFEIDDIQIYPYDSSADTGIVTAGQGAAISPAPALLMERVQRTNYANNANDLSGGADTIDLTASGTGDYTLSVTGTASVTVAAGTATGTGFGTATAGSPVTFNLSAAGTVTLTLNSGGFDAYGDSALYNLEKGSTPTSPIPTDGTAVTRNADELSYTVDTPNETRAIVDGAAVDADDWDGVVDATLLGADSIGLVESIKVYREGDRPA